MKSFHDMDIRFLIYGICLCICVSISSVVGYGIGLRCGERIVYYEFDTSYVEESKYPVYEGLSTELSNYICNLCEELNEDSDLCVAILLQENPTLNSDAQHRNENGTLDVGLFQINDRYMWSTFVPKYWELDVEFNPYNWKMNTFLAVHHINYLHTSLKVLDDAVMAYNCGEGAVMKNRIPESTKLYLASVKRTYNFLKQSRGED